MVDDDELPVREFFEEDEAIGLIARINREDGNIKAELKEKLSISGRPLKFLIDDAIEADLIEEVPMQAGDHPRSTRYQLTYRGKAIQLLFKAGGLDQAHRKLMRLNQLFEEITPVLQELIEKEELDKKRFKPVLWADTDLDDISRDTNIIEDKPGPIEIWTNSIEESRDLDDLFETDAANNLSGEQEKNNEED